MCVWKLIIYDITAWAKQSIEEEGRWCNGTMWENGGIRKVPSHICWFKILLYRPSWYHPARDNKYDAEREYWVELREKGSRSQKQSESEIRSKRGAPAEAPEWYTYFNHSLLTLNWIYQFLTQNLLPKPLPGRRRCQNRRWCLQPLGGHAEACCRSHPCEWCRWTRKRSWKGS